MHQLLNKRVGEAGRLHRRYKGFDDSDVNVNFFCPVGVPPCANNKNVLEGSLECVYPNETTLHEARAKALAEPQARLQRALDPLALSQAIRALQDRSRIETTFAQEYFALRTSWARASESAASPTR